MSNAYIDFFDKISFFVYITHNIFCVGKLKIFTSISIYIPIQIIITTILSILIGYLLQLLTSKINCKLYKK